MSDTAIMTGIVIFFVSLGVLLPFIHEGFNQTQTNLDVENIEFEYQILSSGLSASKKIGFVES